MNRTWKGVGICCVIVLLFVTLLFEVDIGRAALQRRRGSRAEQARKVDELFKRNCARCHGADGRGDTPLGHMFNAPDFTDPDWWSKRNMTNGRLAATVTRGKTNMPAFGKKLKKTEIALLVARVRRFRK